MSVLTCTQCLVCDPVSYDLLTKFFDCTNYINVSSNMCNSSNKANCGVPWVRLIPQDAIAL